MQDLLEGNKDYAAKDYQNALMLYGTVDREHQRRSVSKVLETAN